MILIENMCLPPTCLYGALFRHGHICLEQHENYQKRSFRNRIYMDSARGRSLFTVPLKKGKHEQQPIRHVRIAYDTDWIYTLEKQLETNYRSAPFYDFYRDSLLAIFRKATPTLFLLNLDLLKWSIDKLGWNCEISLTKEYVRQAEKGVQDLRNKILPNRLPDLGTSTIKYEQVHMDKHAFIRNLSIIDLLFCCGPESALRIQNTA